jgi:hypothetical protein
MAKEIRNDSENAPPEFWNGRLSFPALVLMVAFLQQ